MIGDWSSYDGVAERYDDVWGSRFRTVARFLGERLPLARGKSVLDIGTGTGIVLDTLSPPFSNGSRLTGCDRSMGMIRRARRRVPAGRFVAAEAGALPFADASFDAVTASFVLSHLEDPAAGLCEARRVLKAGGRFAMASWAANDDVHEAAWRELLAAAVAEERLRAAVARVAPHESRFESPEKVDTALAAAGFAGVEVYPVSLDYTIPLDDFLADRELSSAGRFARHDLGGEAWSQWMARSRDVLGGRFGPTLECSRRALIGLGWRPA